MLALAYQYERVDYKLCLLGRVEDVNTAAI